VLNGKNWDMQRYFSGIFALCWVFSIALVWSPGTLPAEDSRDQALYREVTRAVGNKDWARASAALDRWLTWRTEHYGAQSKESGAAYWYCGEVYAKAGQHARAIEAFRRALAIFNVDPGPRSKEVGLLLVAIAEAQQALGQGGEAIASLRQALVIFEVDPGPEAPMTATCLNKLSLLLLYRDAFYEAEQLMQRALKIREKLYGDQIQPDLAASLGNLGLLYFQLGAYEEAEKPLSRALDILNILAAKDPAYLLGASNVRRTLASLYAAQGKLNEAEVLLQRVIDDTRKQFGNDSIEVADATVTLAGIQLNGKRFKEAEIGFTKALEIQSRKLPADHEAILRTRNSLAISFQYQGKYDEARQILEQVVAICVKKLGPDHPLTIAVTHNLGMTLVTLGEKAGAREYTKGFMNLLADNLEKVLAYFPENRRLSYVRNMGFSPYDLAATLGDGPLTADAVLTFKTAVLESVARDRRRALLASDSDDARLVEQINELRQQFLEAELAGDTDRTKNLATRLDEQEKELSRRLRDEGTYKPFQQVAWESVASRLPAGTVLLEFVFYNKHLGVDGGWRGWCGAVALSHEREPVFRELGPSDEILKSISSYLHLAARDSERDDEASVNTKTETACRDLFDRLILPFTDVMPPDGAQLFICADGPLSFVSFATLLDHNDKFLASRFQVCYVDSGRVFLERSEAQKSQAQMITLLGDPDFDGSDASANAVPALKIASRGGASEQELRAEVSRGILGDIRFDRIPGTAEEVKAIDAVFRQNGWQTRLLLGSAATEAELKAVVPGASIIHLATHGYFMPEFTVGSQARISNPMFRSWMALTGANATLRAWEKGEVPPAANDGILMAAEVTSFDLHAAELVVLSACDTARGEARNGEGILGLRRGIALAGAKNLLLTTWEIQDEYTVKFMKLFYGSILAGDSPAAALHKVQAIELTTLRKEQGTFLAVHFAGPFLVTFLKN
jgi:CHAT domain-containing protein/tetratricopeptide (TPR) repeat protein